MIYTKHGRKIKKQSEQLLKLGGHSASLEETKLQRAIKDLN